MNFLSSQNVNVARMRHFLWFLNTVIFQALDSVGLRQTDPRLATMMKIFKQMKKDQGIASMHSLVMGRDDFKA